MSQRYALRIAAHAQSVTAEPKPFDWDHVLTWGAVKVLPSHSTRNLRMIRVEDGVVEWNRGSVKHFANIETAQKWAEEFTYHPLRIVEVVGYEPETGKVTALTTTQEA